MFGFCFTMLAVILVSFTKCFVFVFLIFRKFLGLFPPIFPGNLQEASFIFIYIKNTSVPEFIHLWQATTQSTQTFCFGKFTEQAQFPMSCHFPQRACALCFGRFTEHFHFPRTTSPSSVCTCPSDLVCSKCFGLFQASPLTLPALHAVNFSPFFSRQFFSGGVGGGSALYIQECTSVHKSLCWFRGLSSATLFSFRYTSFVSLIISVQTMSVLTGSFLQQNKKHYHDLYNPRKIPSVT